MYIQNTLLHLLALIHFATCRDFYLGMFKKNDLLMSQDTLYKERLPFRFSYAKYGRKYNCPITYVRVVDRLNIGRGPRVEVIRGGLRQKYIVLRLTSPYNNPIAVNIFVGCENKKFTNPPWKIIRPTKKPTTTKKPTVETTESVTNSEKNKTSNESTLENEENTTESLNTENGSTDTSVGGNNTATMPVEGEGTAETLATEEGAAEAPAEEEGSAKTPVPEEGATETPAPEATAEPPAL